MHEFVIALDGGAPGVRDPNALAASAARPFLTVGGKPAFPTVFDRAAALMEAIAKHHHPFVDGNKRTAAMASGYVLRRNELALTVPDLELENVTLSVATCQLEGQALADWFHEHNQPRNPSAS